MKHSILFLFGVLLAALAARGQTSMVLSLSEAQDYAIQNNLALKSERLDLKISELKVKEAIAQGLPQITAGLDYTSYFNYEMEFSFDMGGDVNFTPAQIAEATDNTLGQFSGVPAMGINPVTYQDIYNFQAGSYFNNQLSAMLPKSTIKMTDQSTGNIQIGQLIFSGQYWVGIQTAKLGKQIADQGLENSVLNIKETVANTYFMILVTQKTLGIFAQNIDNLSRIKDHTQRMYEAGILEQTDVDQLQIQLAMLQNSQRSIQRGVEMTYSLLRFQLGLEPGTEIVLSESLDQLMGTIKPGETNSSAMLENNATLQLMQTQEAITEKMLKMEKMAYAPTVTGFYAYNQKFLTTGFDMTPNHIAGLSMSIPVFSSGARKHRVNQAKIQVEQAKLSKELVTDQLMMQEKQLQFDLKTAIDDYEAQKENVVVAKRVYDNINRKYEQGMVSSLDLTQVNSNYLQAESAYIQSH
jgi:outer membrane protein